MSEDRMSFHDAVAALNAQSASERGEGSANDTTELNTDNTPDVSEQEATNDTEGLDENQAADSDGSGDDDDLDLELEEEDSQPTDKLEAPKVWKAEDREAFASLSRKDQEFMLRVVNEKNSFAESKVQEAAETRKLYEQKAQVLAQHTQNLEQVLQVQQMNNHAKYANIDWARFYDQDFEGATKWRAQMEADKEAFEQSVQYLQQVKAQQEEIQTEREKEKLANLMERDPSLKALNDPKVAQRVVDYAISEGYTMDDVFAAGAHQIVDTYRAMLLKEARERAAKKTKEVVQAKTTKTVPKMNSGAGSNGGTSSVPAGIREAQARFDKNPTQANMLALMNAKSAMTRKQ